MGTTASFHSVPPKTLVMPRSVVTTRLGLKPAPSPSASSPPPAFLRGRRRLEELESVVGCGRVKYFAGSFFGAEGGWCNADTGGPGRHARFRWRQFGEDSLQPADWQHGSLALAVIDELGKLHEDLLMFAFVCRRTVGRGQHIAVA